MKVNEYLVSEILDLKSNIKYLQQDIERKDAMISLQHNTIARLENREEEYKAHSNQIYGRLCDVRKIIIDNVFNISMKTENLEWLLKLLNVDDLKLLNVDDNEQEVSDEVPED